MTQKDGIYMNIFRNTRKQGAARSFERHRLGIINNRVTPLPVVYCSPRLSEGRQTSSLSEFMQTGGEMFTVFIFTSSLGFSLYMIHGLVTGGVSW